MNEQEDSALRFAFEAILTASAEPSLPSVANAAVAGGRRIRRRHTMVSAAGVLVLAALTATAAAVGLPGSGPDRHVVPLTPASTSPPAPISSPHPTRTAAPVPLAGVPQNSAAATPVASSGLSQPTTSATEVRMSPQSSGP